MTPLVLDEEEAVGEDKQHGEDYQDHHQQATVKRPHGLWSWLILIRSCQYRVNIPHYSHQQLGLEEGKHHLEHLVRRDIELILPNYYSIIVKLFQTDLHCLERR